MKIYLAGNFPQMATVEKEYKILHKTISKTDYCRLVSFYFSSAANPAWELTDNVIQAVKQFMEQKGKE